MISGATRGAGGRALGAHLADAKQLNEITELGLSRGLVGDTIRAQIAELADLSSHSRAAQPLYHLHADPPPGATWNESTWQRYWSLTEAEFDLQRAAFSEERHVKDGREHRHRVYNLVRDDGTTNPMAHDFQRREKLSRIMEFETGAPLTPGSHNRAVAAALDRDGRPDVAAAMREAGLHTMERPRAATTPAQRAQAERTGVDPRVVGATLFAAWSAADGGHAFAAALREQGLELARGTKTAVVVDRTGGTHSLAKLLGTQSKAAGMTRIAAADVRERLAGLDLPQHVPGAADAAGTPDMAPAVEAVLHVAAAPSPKPSAVEMAQPVVEVSTPPAALSDPVPASSVEAPRPAPAARAAPIPDGGKGAASGGGGTDPFAGIAPLDPNKPGDWIRFLNATATAQAAKLRADAAAAETARTTGGQHDPELNHRAFDGLADAISDAVRAALERRAERVGEIARVASGPSGSEAGVDGRGPARDRGDGREGQPVHAPGDGPAGAGTRAVRGIPGGPDLGPPPPTPGSAGTGGEGDIAARPGDPAPRSDRRKPDPDRAARGRTRVQTRRASFGLATAVQARGNRFTELTRALAAPPTVAELETERVRAAMAVSRAWVASVLATAPWPDPADRNRHLRECAARDLVNAAVHAREAAAVAAVDRAERLRGRVNLVARALAAVGLQTPSVRAAAAAVLEAAEAERAAKNLRLAYKHDLVHADRSGAAEADRRQRDQDQWEDRAVVKAARREEVGNRMVAAATKTGDLEIKEALAGEDGLRIARKLLFRREMDQMAEIRRQQQLHDQRMAPVYGAVPAPAGPRPF